MESNLIYIGRRLFSRDPIRRHFGWELLRAELRAGWQKGHREEPTPGSFEASPLADTLRALGFHYAGISTISGSNISTGFQWNCSNNLTGAAYNPINNNGSIRKSYTLGTAAANSATGGADECITFQQAIAAGGSATVNLNNLTNILQQTGIALARIKAYQLRLLAAADDSTITTPVATSITVTNAGIATPSPLDFQTAGSGLTVTLSTGGGGAVTGVSIGAGGTGYPASSYFQVTPNQAGGSGCILDIGTNGSGVCNSASIASGGLAAGSGYANGTVSATVNGYKTIWSGGTGVYFDVQAAGFLLVSSTSKNILILNNDASHVATFELDLFGGTT